MGGLALLASVGACSCFSRLEDEGDGEDEDDPGVLLNAWLGELDSLQKVSGLRCVGALKR